MLGKEVNRSWCLPAPKELRVPRKAIRHGRRHGNAGQNGQNAKYKNDGKISTLLQRVVAVKTVWLGRQVKRRVVYPGVPGLKEYYRRRWHKTPPLVRGEQHGDEENTADGESMNTNEIPYARHADVVHGSRC